MLTNNKEVLLIDDNDIDNLVFSRYFEDLNLNIHTELNGQAGLDYLQSCVEKGEAPFLIVLDIHMPFLNGFEFLKIYRKMYKSSLTFTKIVILTSSVNIVDKEKATLFPFIDDFFIKPFNKETKRRFEEILKMATI